MAISAPQGFDPVTGLRIPPPRATEPAAEPGQALAAAVIQHAPRVTAAPPLQLVGMEDELEAIDHAINNGYHVLVMGDTGIGKTAMIYQLANKHQKTLHRVNLNGDIGLNELIGKWLVKDGSTYWQDGILTKAIKADDWIVLDEINAALPEVLFCLNSLLDDGKSIVLSEKDNEVLKLAKPDIVKEAENLLNRLEEEHADDPKTRWSE